MDDCSLEVSFERFEVKASPILRMEKQRREANHIIVH